MDISAVPRRYRIAAGAFYFIQGLTFATWASRIPDVRNALNLSDSELGSILFAIPAGQLAAMALSGYLVGRFGSRAMLRLAGVLYPGLLLPLGMAGSFWPLAAMLFLFGMGANLCNISINTQCVGVERLYGRSIMASFHGLWSGAGLTGVAFSMLMVRWGVAPFAHFATVNVLTLAIFVLWRNQLLPRDRRAVESAGRKLAVDRQIMLLGVIAFGCLACEGAMYDWSGVYFATVIRPGDNLIRLGYLAYMLAITCCRFSADHFVRRYGVAPVIRASGFLMCGGLLLATLLPFQLTATIGFAVVGFGTGSVVPLCYSLAGKSKIVLASTAIATVSTVGFLGFLLAPPVIGFVAEASGLRLALALMGVIGLAATQLVGLIPNGKPGNMTAVRPR